MQRTVEDLQKQCATLKRDATKASKQLATVTKKSSEVASVVLSMCKLIKHQDLLATQSEADKLKSHKELLEKGNLALVAQVKVHTDRDETTFMIFRSWKLRLQIKKLLLRLLCQNLQRLKLVLQMLLLTTRSTTKLWGDD